MLHSWPSLKLAQPAPLSHYADSWQPQSPVFHGILLNEWENDRVLGGSYSIYCWLDTAVSTSIFFLVIIDSETLEFEENEICKNVKYKKIPLEIRGINSGEKLNWNPYLL